MNEESELSQRVRELENQVAVLRGVVLLGFAILGGVVVLLFWPVAPALLLCGALLGFLGLVAYPVIAALRAGLGGTAGETDTKHDG